MILDAMPPMLMSIVRDVIEADHATEIVASGLASHDLLRVAETARPDAIILGSADAPLTDREFVTRLLRRGEEPVRVLALAEGSRTAVVHELRAHITVIEDLSPGSLLLAIRGEAEGGDEGLPH